MPKQIRIAVASGKGGTGKTMVASSLALSLARWADDFGVYPMPTSPAPLLFLDGDVEAPNAHLFLKPEIVQRKEVGNLVPIIDVQKCTFCGRCAEVCQFHAIAVLGKKTLVFYQLCHGCGSCTLNCPENAISEKLHGIGVLESGQTRDGIDFAQGIMNVGEPMAVPIIHQLKLWVSKKHYSTVIIDAPPGSSCPVVETIRNVDFLLLVTEPTPFGLHDLRLAIQLAKELNLPYAVILNRADIGDHQVEAYCQAENIPILARIPYRREIAQTLAEGLPLVDKFPEYLELFQEVFCSILAKLNLSKTEAG